MAETAVRRGFRGRDTALRIERRDDRHALILRKPHAGFDADAVDAALDVLAAVGAQGLDAPHFVVFDFAHTGHDTGVRPAAFAKLIRAVSDVILDAQVVTIACARAEMSGTDLELALTASMLVATPDARFHFDGATPVVPSLYRTLAGKLGFVRAERVLEREDHVLPEEMSELLLMKEIIAREDGPAGLDGFLERMERRHNSSCGIYRAQRLALPTMADHLDL